MGKKSKGKTCPDAVKALDIRLECVRLRAEGMSFAQIARQLKIAASAAHRHILVHIAERNSQMAGLSRDFLEADWARTELLLEEFFPKAMNGSLDAFDRVLRLLERRAKYRGLDAPVRTDSTINASVTHGRAVTREQMQAEIAARMQKLTQRMGTETN